MAEPWRPRGALSLRAVWWPLLVLAALVVGAALAVPGLAQRSGGSPAAPAPPMVKFHQAAINDPEAVAARESYRALPRFVNADNLPQGWIMTSWGPLGPADRDVLVRVRTAGLWEGPVGQQAQKLAASKRVKEVGLQLYADHTALDVQVRQVAAQLQVQLPDQPTREQQGWIDELAGKRADDYDRTFADRLRAAHGKVFGIVAAVRAGTRNDLVRTFAQTGINVVMKHMTLLESTSLVNYDALPTPSDPPAATIAGAPLNDSRNAVIWIVLGLALLAGIPAAIRVIRLRR